MARVFRMGALLLAAGLAVGAAAAEDMTISAAVTPALSSYMTSDQARLAGVDIMNGAVGTMHAAQRHQSNIYKSIDQRLTSPQAIAATGFSSAGAYARAPGPEYLANRVWATGFYTWENQNKRGGRTGFDFDNGGVTLGYDHAFGALTVGGAFGYSDGWVKSHSGKDNKTDVEMFLFSGYGAFRCGDFFVDGTLFYGHGNQYTRAYPTPGNVSKGSYDTDLFGLGGRVGYNFRFNAFRVTPSAGLDWTYANLDGFNESGAGITRHFSDSHWQSLEMPVGVTAAYTIRSGGNSFIPEVGAFWVHEWGDNEASTRARYNVGGPSGAGSWRVSSVEFDRDSLMITAGLKARFGAVVDAGIGYEGRFSSGRYDHTILGSFGIKF